MDKLTALSGESIVVKGVNLIIDQPTIKQISLVGEKDFFQTVSWWNFNKEVLRGREGVEDEVLDKSTNLDWMIQSLFAKDSAITISTVLGMIFSRYDIGLKEGSSSLWFAFKEQPELPPIEVDAVKFEKVKEVLNSLFLLERAEEEEEDRYASDAARRIAEKLKQGRQKVAQHKGEDKTSGYILLNMVSGLSVSLGVSIKEVLELTLYQMYDQFRRVQKKDEYERGMQAIIAGATDVELESWYGDL